MNWIRTKWTITLAVAVVALAIAPQQGNVQMVSAKSYVFGTMHSYDKKPTPAPTTAGGDGDYGNEPVPTPAATTLDDDFGEEEPIEAPAPTPAATTLDDDYGEEEPTEAPAPTPSKTPCKKQKIATEKPKSTLAKLNKEIPIEAPAPTPAATTLDDDYGEEEPIKAPAAMPESTTLDGDYGEKQAIKAPAPTPSKPPCKKLKNATEKTTPTPANFREEVPTNAPAPTPSKIPCKKLKNATEESKVEAAAPVENIAKPNIKVSLLPALSTLEDDYGDEPVPMTPTPTPSKSPCKYPLKETQAPIKPTPQPIQVDDGDYGDDVDNEYGLEVTPAEESPLPPVDVLPKIDDSYGAPDVDGFSEAALPPDDSYGDPPVAGIDELDDPAAAFPSPIPSKTPCTKNKTATAPSTVGNGNQNRAAKGGLNPLPVKLTNTSNPVVTPGVQPEEADEVFDNIHEGECAGKITIHDMKELAKNCAKTFDIKINGKTLHTCVNCPSGFTETGAYPYFKCGVKPLCSRFLSFTNVRPDDLLCAVKNSGKDDLMTVCDFEG